MSHVAGQRPFAYFFAMAHKLYTRERHPKVGEVTSHVPDRRPFAYSLWPINFIPATGSLLPSLLVSQLVPPLLISQNQTSTGEEHWDASDEPAYDSLEHVGVPFPSV